ncbi:hypothetical protein JCM3766R1_005492 [Sporobolomyces carnicolor]
MSFSDLTRSYSTFPSVSQTASLRISIVPVVVSTSASEGPSNIPGSSIAAGLTNAAARGTAAALSTSSAASSQSGGINSDLALGLGLGLGISALLAICGVIFVLKSRKAQKADFERRAEVIRDTVETAKARPVVN